MRTRATSTFTSLTTEGALLPADLLRRIADGDKSVDGLSEASYHLTEGEKLSEAISRSWTRLTGAWAAFRTTRERLPESDLGTTLTRDRWLLPLFQELGYGRLGVARGFEIEGVSYPLSHIWQNVPIHLASFKTDLDTRTSGVAGAARRSPHSLVQELLNKSDRLLWGFVSNGTTLRILRDNASLTRQAYVEFDLTAMFDGDVYSDFVVLWLLAHESRVEAEHPEEFWLETWSKAAKEQGVRALDQLRVGVEHAIQALGSGFLVHPANSDLKERLRSGVFDKQDYYRQLLRLVYRLLFLFVAEDRDVLLVPETSSSAKATYRDYYSTTRLRQLAARRRGTRHGDLWEALRLVMELLGRDDGCVSLGLPALGSFLFSGEAIPDLARCGLANRDLLAAVRELSVTDEGGIRRQVDFRNLRSEELGSVYEALLEQHPEIHAESATFELRTAAGHERKTTGSYYTPDSLVQCLLDSALEPVLAEAARMPDPEKAILDLKVCDPACGSGHFLVAAAHRIAKRLAALRTGDEEPSPEATRHALRDVIGRCIYGVDLNPMAVELCKVALWMEAIEPGRPLSFLEHHIQCGNSLLGTTPSLLEEGIPDGAFEPLTDDDREVCSALKKRNRKEREGQMSLTFIGEPHTTYLSVRSRLEAIGVLDDATIDGIRAKEHRWREVYDSPDYRKARLVADAWCAAFVSPKQKGDALSLTTGALQNIRRSPQDLAPVTKSAIEGYAEDFRFFHWALAFPEVFGREGKVEEEIDPLTGWTGGFDVVLGNPPWERTSFEEVPFFASKVPDIARAATTKRRRELIADLTTTNPSLHREYLHAKNAASRTELLLSASGLFRLSARGRFDTFALFADLAARLVAPGGLCGVVVPTGIATSIPLKELWADLFNAKRVHMVADFENRGMFPAVDSRKRICIFVVGGAHRLAESTTFAFRVMHISSERISSSSVRLDPDAIAAINPNTKLPPIVPSARDLRLLVQIHANAKMNEATTPGWVGYTSAGTGDSWVQLNDSSAQRDGNPSDTFVPLVEGKLINQFDHRYATYSGCSADEVERGVPRVLDDKAPESHAVTRFVVPTTSAILFLARKGVHEGDPVGVYRDYTSASNERTLIATLIPVGVPVQPLNGFSIRNIADEPSPLGRLNSLVVDYAARLKTPDIHLNVTIFDQLPGEPKISDATSKAFGSLKEWIDIRVLELCVTSVDAVPIARSLGYETGPLRWDDQRRFLLRCELDAAFFHLYGLERDDVAYILDTFPIIKRKDEKEHGEYKTKRVILEIYDTMEVSIRTGQAYQTRLDPPPADPRCCHPKSQAAKG